MRWTTGSGGATPPFAGLAVLSEFTDAEIARLQFARWLYLTARLNEGENPLTTQYVGGGAS
jgi:hypothetical protein